MEKCHSCFSVMVQTVKENGLNSVIMRSIRHLPSGTSLISVQGDDALVAEGDKDPF